MTLRRANPDDIIDILHLDHQVLKTNWHERLYLEEMENEAAIFNVLMVDTQFAGFILLRRSDEIYEILQFAIIETLQGQGLGSVLFDLSIEALVAEALFLEVSSNNIKAQDFYLRKGFEQIRIRKNYYGADEDALVMRKRLI